MDLHAGGSYWLYVFPKTRMCASQELVLATSHVPLLRVFHLVPPWPAPGPRALGFKVDGGKEREAQCSRKPGREREHSGHQAGRTPGRG